MLPHDPIHRHRRDARLTSHLLHRLLRRIARGGTVAIILKHLQELLFLLWRQFLGPAGPRSVLDVFLFEPARGRWVVAPGARRLLEAIDGRLGHARHGRDAIDRDAFLDQS